MVASMKLFNLLIVAIVLSASCLLSNNQIQADSKLSQVKVFQSGAELNYNASIALKKGENIVVFSGIPANIKENDIRSFVSDGASVSLLQIFSKTNTSTDIPAELIEIKNLIDSNNVEISTRTNRISILNEEVNVLRAFTISPTQNYAVTTKDLKELTSFRTTRHNEINKEISTLNQEINFLKKKIEVLNKEYSTRNEKYRPPATNFLQANIYAEKQGTYDIIINFFTANAGWTPYYEIKAVDTKSPISLFYKAKVWQNSGIDWNDVDLTLSTRNPNENNNIPVLTPNYLRIIKNVKISSQSMDSPLSPSKSYNVRGSRNDDVNIRVDGLEAGYISSSVQSNYFSMEFTPSAKYTIPTDQKIRQISFNRENIPASYEYYCVPKLSTSAFLTARIADWGKYYLLPGEASIYFADSYVGKTNFSLNNASDTLNLSLGKDNKIIIKRDIIKDYTETKFLSRNIIRDYAFEISLLNNRSEPITINIQDQVPVSTHEDIEVKIADTSGAVLENATGYLSWKINIPANKSKNVSFKYTVTQPKD